MNLWKQVRSAYLPFQGFAEQLREEIPKVIGSHGDLLLSSSPPINPLWAQNTWSEVQLIGFESIGDAARKLKALHPLWYPYIQGFARRTQLILEKLPHPRKLRQEAYGKLGTSLGSFTLLSENLLLASARCSSPRPNGMWEFVEDKSGPPNRAYLKLWEVFTRLNIRPDPQSICLEIGAAPGGWSWVLAPLCQKLITYDRAPLADTVAALGNIEQHQGNAFTVFPEQYPEVDWIFSDIICYPPKLYEWVEKWLADGKKRNFICTIKLQERKHYEWIEKFAQIKNSQVLHLYHNKHELTWVCLA